MATTTLIDRQKARLNTPTTYLALAALVRPLHHFDVHLCHKLVVLRVKRTRLASAVARADLLDFHRPLLATLYDELKGVRKQVSAMTTI
jgi:hypothetical protein